MLIIGTAQIEGTDSYSVIQRAIQQAKQALDQHEAQAAMLFTGIEFDHQIVLDEIYREFPHIVLVGCTGAAQLSSHYGFSEFAISLTLFSAAEIEFRVGVGMDANKAPIEAAQVAVETAKQELKQREQICILLADPVVCSDTTVLQVLEEKLAEDCLIFGGCAAKSSLITERPKQFFNRQIVQNAVPILLLAGELEFSFSLSKGWAPIGIPHQIKGVSGKEVNYIGTMKAADFYQLHLGEHESPSPEFPLAVYEPGKDDFYLRVPVAYNLDKKSVIFGATLPKNATVQLTQVTTRSILEETHSAIQEALDHYPGEHPNAAFIFSCNARKSILGTKAGKELEIIQTNLPSHFPVTGFYGFAELSPLKMTHGCKVHHTSMIVLLLGCSTTTKLTTTYLTDANPNNHMSNYGEQEELILLRHENDLLKRKLVYSEYYRTDLEKIQASNASLVLAIERARHEVQQKTHLLEESNIELKLALDNIEQIKKKLESQTRTDSLTRVFNRAYFLELANFQLGVCCRYRQVMSMMFIDLDHFKKINDTYGHLVGDAVLIRTANKLQASIRSCDVLARFGGEEFVVMLPNTDAEQAFILAERIRTVLASEPIKLKSGEEIGITLSIGIVCEKQNRHGLDKLIQLADEAVYLAKRNGRNRCEVSDADI